VLRKVKTALGSLDLVERIVKVLGMVNSADGFSDRPGGVHRCTAEVSRWSSRVPRRVRSRPHAMFAV
jgi:hypothetical protein